MVRLDSSQKNSQILGLAALVIAGVLVVGFFIFQPKAGPEQITIAEFSELFIYAPLYVAQEKGFFAEQGLDITIVPAGGLDKTWAAVVSKSAQFGVADPMITAISAEKGQPGVVVAGMLRGAPYWGVAKNPAISAIQNPSQLEPYTIGTQPSPSTAFTMQTRMFKQAGLTPAIREFAPGTCLAALERNQVDICLELEPAVSTSVANGSHVVYAMQDYYPTFALTGLFGLPEYVQQHPQTVQKVVNALQKSLSYIRQNPQETTDLLLKRFPNVPPIIARNAVDRMIQSNVFPTDTLVPKDGWDIAGELRVQVGHLKQPPHYEQFVQPGFAQNAR